MCHYGGQLRIWIDLTLAWIDLALAWSDIDSSISARMSLPLDSGPGEGWGLEREQIYLITIFLFSENVHSQNNDHFQNLCKFWKISKGVVNVRVKTRRFEN